MNGRPGGTFASRWMACAAVLAFTVGVGGCAAGGDEKFFPAAPQACSLVNTDTRQRLLGTASDPSTNVYETNGVAGTATTVCTWFDENRKAQITVQADCWWDGDGAGGTRLLRERFEKLDDGPHSAVPFGDGGYFSILPSTSGGGDQVEVWLRVRNLSALVRYSPAHAAGTFEQDWRSLAAEVARNLASGGK